MTDLPWLPWLRPSSYDDRPCVRDERIELTYADVGVRVDALADQLAGHGITRGSVVAVMLPNRVELLLTILAAWRLGAAATPVNPTLTASEAGHQIGDSGAVVVVTSDPAARFEGAVVLHVDDLATKPTADAAALPPATTEPNDLALLVYTSGSTGRPKGVMLDHANLSAMIASMGAAIGIQPEDHCLLVLPLFHVNAICVSWLTPMSVGAQLSILSRFHPVEFLTSVATLRPTYFSAVPTIYSHLLALPAEVASDTGSVRFAVCGAAPAPPELLTGIEERFGFPMVEGYGLSEGTCASTVNPIDGIRKVGTVGPALPDQTVAIMAPDGSLLPTGERGEVVIQGPTVMRGYLNLPDETAAALKDGWLHTGDVGILDEDGYLRLVDRIKDLIIRGGENISPKEIENVLHADPSVLEAAAVGRPDPTYGEVPVAFVAPAPGVATDSVDIGRLTERCREQLTKVKVPVAIHVLDALPKNPVGKIDKPALRALLTELTTAGTGA